MKGTLHKTEQGWVVRYKKSYKLDSEEAQYEGKSIIFYDEKIPLHPETEPDFDFNRNMEGVEVEFEIVGIDLGSGISQAFAKIIVPKLGNEDVPKLGYDVREQALLLRWLLKHYSTHITEDGFFCYVDSMGKETDIKDILEHYLQELPKQDDVREDDIEKLAANLANPNADKTDNWKEGYLYAKETLYTEERVIGFGKWAYSCGWKYNANSNNWYSNDGCLRTDKEMIYDYIQSLKQ